MPSNTPLTGDLLHQDELWNAYVERVGLGNAMHALNDAKSELRRQRREREVTKQTGTLAERRVYYAWMAAQARYQATVDRRLLQVRAQLAELAKANPDGTSGALRKGMTELVDLVADLALAIDNTELEYLLLEHHIVLGHERMTLADAIDTGRFDRRRKKKESTDA